MRLSSTQYRLRDPTPGEMVNKETMKCSWINGHDEMQEQVEPSKGWFGRSKASPIEVGICVLPSLWKKQNPEDVCLVEAKVIPKQAAAQSPKIDSKRSSRMSWPFH
jgi:hypothetical protein